MKKVLLISILLFSIFGFGQQKQELIDSIHTKRLCTSYPGMTKFQTIKESLNESEFVFSGKVIEIIRTEKMQGTDYGMDENGDFVPTHHEPTFNYWYVFEIEKLFKGTEIKEIKIYARKLSGVMPFFKLNENYLIFAKKGEIQEQPYVYCQGNSMHLKNAENEVIELEKLTE